MHGVFDREYQAICDDVVRMGGMIEAAIGQAMQALVERDVPLAEQVIAGDEKVNEIRFKIEEACLTIIATQQRIAGDLRSVVAAMHIAVELERMGDHAAGIARTVVLMSDEPLLKTIKKIPKMGELSRQMLSDCMQAFVKRDAQWAREIAANDGRMDELYKAVFDRLVETMAHKPELVARATYLMWTAHNLERIADRVTNIAERIDFMTTGDLKEFHI